MKCQRCQLDVSAAFAFCPGCGNKLAAASAAAPVAAADADRRSATVLFADLTGFTTISEKLDPEEVRALQTDLFATLSGVVERFDAFVEKFVGDAVMAVFGAPVAHEDDPQRALHAALEMHAGVAVLNERWRDRLGHPLTTTAAVALKKEAKGTPVVFVNVVDPIGSGLVASLARPGGSFTWFIHFEPRMASKRLEMLKQVAPRLTRVAVLYSDKTLPSHASYMRAVEAAAPSFAIVPIATPANDAAEVEHAIDAFAGEPGGGLIVLPDATDSGKQRPASIAS